MTRTSRTWFLAAALAVLAACSGDDSPTAPGGVGVAEGAWSGQTGQGKAIGFDVVDGEVTNIFYTFYKEAPNCQDCCSIGHSTSQEFPIRGNRFELTHEYAGTSWTVTGFFTSPN